MSGQSNALQIFDIEGAGIRFGSTDTGVPYAVASDYAKVIGYRDAEKATRLLDEDEKGTQIVRTPGGPQEMSVIYEDGMWELIFRSSLPGAKAVKSRVKAILRQIRETGSYSAPVLVDPLAELERQTLLTSRAIEIARAERGRAQLAEARAAELEPKALAHDTLIAAEDGDLLVRQAAKAIGWPEKQLRRFLIDEKLLFRRKATCGASQYDFYAAHADCFNAVETVVEHSWGLCAHYTLLLTPRGLAFVQMRISRRQAELRAVLGGPTG